MLFAKTGRRIPKPRSVHCMTWHYPQHSQYTAVSIRLRHKQVLDRRTEQTVYCHITDGGDITYLPIVVTVHRKIMQTPDDDHNVDRNMLGLI